MTLSHACPSRRYDESLALIFSDLRDPHRHTSCMPPEIIDYIIGLLREDSSALCSCRLVCRSWAPASKYHLFHHLKLTPTARTKSHLYSMLSSETLPHVVENLTLANSMESLFHHSDFFDMVIPLLAPRLSHINSLNLIYFDFSRLSLSSQSSILTHFTTLRTLSLTAVTFGHFHDLTGLILAHPEVRNLNLTRVGWADDHLPYSFGQDSYKDPGTHKLCLSNIALVDLPVSIVEWFTTNFSELDIKGLIWNSVMCQTNLSVLLRFLNVAGPSLQSLSVSFSYDGSMSRADSTELARFSLLEHTKNLRSLTLDHIFLINDASQNYLWIPHFLSRLQSQHLEEVIFDVVWVHIDRLKCFDWSGIEAILCQPQFFRNLKKVVLRSSVRRSDKGRKPSFEDFIRTKWSRLQPLVSSIIFE